MIILKQFRYFHENIKTVTLSVKNQHIDNDFYRKCQIGYYTDDINKLL